MTSPTTITEQTLLPLSPESPPDLEQVRIDVLSLEGRENPKPNAALRESVAKWGVLQSVLVHYVDGKNIIVDGNRRWMAARMAQEKHPESDHKVPCLRTSDLRYLKHVATIMMNETRDKNPAAEFEAIDALVQQGYDLKTIARETGMPMSTIKKRLEFANLIPALRDQAKDGRIKAGVVEKLSKLSQSEQKQVLMDATESGEDGPTINRITLDDVKDVRRVANQAAMESLPGDLFDDLPVTQDLIEDQKLADFARFILSTGRSYTQVVDRLRKVYLELFAEAKSEAASCPTSSNP